MNVTKVELEAVAVRPIQYPISQKPEIAFVGRSNVGKSSLINKMVGRNAIARVSKNPGKTRTINFYSVNDLVNFVDLPGYGYARLSKVQIETWSNMIENYLLSREQLKAIILLLDIRHEPTNNDVLMYNWLKHYGYNVCIAATKADKIKRSQLLKCLSILRKGLSLEKDVNLIPFSSESGAGKDELWAIIENFSKINSSDKY